MGKSLYAHCTIILSNTYLVTHAKQSEFVLLLLPLLTRKIKRTVPSLLAHPPLLAHTIYQALVFDAALLEEGFTIQGTSASQGGKTSEPRAEGGVGKWVGVSNAILGRKEWFDAWLAGEKQCEYGNFSLSSTFCSNFYS